MTDSNENTTLPQNILANDVGYAEPCEKGVQIFVSEKQLNSLERITQVDQLVDAGIAYLNEQRKQVDFASRIKPAPKQLVLHMDGVEGDVNTLMKLIIRSQNRTITASHKFGAQGANEALLKAAFENALFRKLNINLVGDAPMPQEQKSSLIFLP